MKARYYKDTAGVTLLSLAVVVAYAFWGAHVLNTEASTGVVSEVVANG